MSDEPTSGEPQAGDPGTNPQPQAGTTSPEPQAGDGKETISLEEARKLRSEAANLRKRMKAYEDADKEREAAKQAAEDAERTELERVKNEHQKAEARIKQQQQQLVMAQVKLASKDKGIINPELIAPVVERKLEYDKDGEPTNLEAVLDELIKGNPYLVKPAEPATTPTQTAPAPGAPPLPAMNVSSAGRSSIPGPGASPTGKPTRLSDLEWSR